MCESMFMLHNASEFHFLWHKCICVFVYDARIIFKMIAKWAWERAEQGKRLIQTIQMHGRYISYVQTVDMIRICNSGPSNV